jgi:hypothetical protein
MNPDADRIFDALKSEVTDLHVRWLIYRQLYAASDEATDLLNRSGSNVFYLLQFMLLDDVALRLAKLTDPPFQGKFENLSLGRLAIALESDDKEFVSTTVSPALEKLEAVCAKFRGLRNKRVAHRDLTHALGLEKEPLPGISREDVEGALACLREAMNVVDYRFRANATVYEHVIVPLSADGNRLLKILGKGLATEVAEKDARALAAQKSQSEEDDRDAISHAT